MLPFRLETVLLFFFPFFCFLRPSLENVDYALTYTALDS